MKNTAQSLLAVRELIRAAEREFSRAPGSVTLVAVCKGQPAEKVREAAAAGQRDFGENYLQEAIGRMDSVAGTDVHWHFIGSIQSNKAAAIAARFHWVHSVDRLKIAQRLAAARPAGMPALNACIQVNVSGEDSKSGVMPSAALELARAAAALPGLRLRGLMALPAPSDDFSEQRRSLRPLRELLEELRRDGLELDTLSMGTSSDLRAAIAEGATLVRVGTAVFGPRS